MGPRFATLLLLAASACATSSAPRPLARVNEEVLTGEDLRQEFARSHRSMDKVLGAEPEVRRYLARIVDRRLLVQEAYRMGLHETADVREGMAKFRSQRALELFMKEEIEDPSKPTDDELVAAYAALSEAVEARQLVFRTRAEADAALAELAGGADFEKLARERSIAPSARRGGVIGMRWGGDEAREKAAFALKAGETTPVFQTPAGWEIVRVETRRETVRPPFEKIRGQLHGTLERRKRHARQKEIFDALFAKYDAKVLECAPTIEELEKAASTKDATPCGTWSGGTLTVQDLLAAVRLPELAKSKELYAELRTAIVDDLLTRKLATLEAEARGYGSRPEIVEKVHQQEEKLVESKLYKDWIIKGVAASDDEAKAYYEGHKDRFVEDPQYELAQIVVDTAERAAEVQEKVRTRQPFEELARAYSKEKDVAKSGGYLGFVPKRALQGAFAPVAALSEGEVAPTIVEGEASFRIVKVLRVNPERQKTFEEAQGEARAAALQEKQAAEQKRWVEKLRSVAKVKLHDRAIRDYEKERNGWLQREQAAETAKKEAEAAREAALVERIKPLAPAPAAPKPAEAKPADATAPAGGAPAVPAAAPGTAPAAAPATAPAAAPVAAPPTAPAAAPAAVPGAKADASAPR